MIDKPKRHCIPEPFPETLGFTAMTIWVPEDFRGDAEIVFWYPGKSGDEHAQRVRCNASWLLQGIFHDVRGTRPGEKFDARVVALALHAFYRLRIEACARLEAAYQLRAYPAD